MKKLLFFSSLFVFVTSSSFGAPKYFEQTPVNLGSLYAIPRIPDVPAHELNEISISNGLPLSVTIRSIEVEYREQTLKNLRNNKTFQLEHLTDKEIKDIASSDKNYSAFIKHIEIKFRIRASEHIRTGFNIAVARFVPESFLFFVALGAIAIEKTLLDFSSNPVRIEQLLQSTKDPIANISFFAFLAAARISTEFLKDPRLSLKEKSFYLQQVLKSVPMGIGSVASHFIGDSLHTLTGCANRVFSLDTNHLNPKHVQEKEAACDLALSEWTLHKKSTTYLPSLISLYLANYMAATFMQKFPLLVYNSLSGVAKALPWTKELHASVRQTLQRGTLVPLKFLVEYFPTPGGMVIKSAKVVVKIASASTTFYIMLRFDEMIRSAVDYHFKNFSLGSGSGTLTPWTSLAEHQSNLNFAIEMEHKRGWLRGNDLVRACTDRKLPTDTPACKALQKAENLRGTRLNSAAREQFVNFNEATGVLEVLKDYTSVLDEWQLNNKAEVQASHAHWIQKIENLIYNETTTGAFISRILDSLKAQSVNQGREEQLKQGADSAKITPPQDFINFFQKTFPLYGVYTPEINPYLLPDSYVANPSTPEPLQTETLLKLGKELEENAIASVEAQLAQKGMALDPIEKNALVEISKIFQSKNLNQIGALLYKIRLFVSLPPHQLVTYFTKPPWVGKNTYPVFTEIIHKIYDILGEPNPKLFPLQGIASAIEESDLYSTKIGKLKTSLGVSGFDQYTDWILYNMVCGPVQQHGELSALEQVSIGKGFSVEFRAPRIIKPELKLEICDQNTLLSMKRSTALYYSDINVTYPQQKTYKGLGQLIYENLNPEFLRLIHSKNPDDTFGEWFRKNIRSQVQRKFEALESDYLEVIKKLLEKFRPHMAISNSGPFSNSLLESAKQELRIYTKLLGQILLQQNPTAFYANQRPGVDNSSSERNKKLKNDLAKYTSPLKIIPGLILQPTYKSLNQINTYRVDQLKFQNELENVYQEIIDILLKIQVVENPGVSGRDPKRLQLVTNIDIEQIKQLKDRIPKLINSLKELFKIPTSDEVDNIMKNLENRNVKNSENLQKIAEQLKKETDPIKKKAIFEEFEKNLKELGNIQPPTLSYASTIAMFCIDRIQKQLNELVTYLQMIHMMKYSTDNIKNIINDVLENSDRPKPSGQPLRGG